jgi:hypothetical protein
MLNPSEKFSGMLKIFTPINTPLIPINRGFGGEMGLANTQPLQTNKSPVIKSITRL